MALDPVPYPLSTGQNFVSAVEYLTDVTPVGNQREYRIARSDNGLVSFDALQGVRSIKDLHAFLSFFRRRKGKARAFLVRDWLDYEQSFDGSLAPIGLATGTAGDEYQLTKTYQQTDDAEAEVRSITKAEYGTIHIYVDTVEETHFTFTNGYQGTVGGTSHLCTVDGKFKFDSGHTPTAGAVIEAKFRFFVPARFVDDKLPLDEIVSYMKPDPNNANAWILGDDASGDLPKVMMIEVKEI